MKTPKTFFFIVWLLFTVIVLPAQNDLKKQELEPEKAFNYPGFNVYATVMNNDAWCHAFWLGIYNFQEFYFDDNEADDYLIFTNQGCISVNKFVPNWYPAEVTGGRIYVGDGEFPGPFLGSQLRVIIFDDNGAGEMPGTAIDSLDVTVNNYYWVEFEGMSAVINSGSFYLGMKQLAAAPDAAPVGVDTDNPTYNISYVYLNGNTWLLSPLQDFMIRAWISVDNTGGNVDYYQVDRFSNFDPNGPPEQGIATMLDSVINPYYNDYEWGSLPPGWYAYGIKEHYMNGQWSEYNISNIVGHQMSFTISIDVTLCDTTQWEYTVIKVNGDEVPAELNPYGATAIIEFNQPEPVLFNLNVYSPGHEPYLLNNFIITPDMVINVPLQCCKFPVSGLAVDPVSLIASWNAPDIVVMEENFENSQFPPAGWQMQSLGDGWFRTEDGSGGGWIIPGWSNHYTAVNDLVAGNNDGSADYLVGPLNLLNYRPDYHLEFNSYFDGLNGQEAFVEYSEDGENWHYFYELDPSSSWEDISLDISPFFDPEGVPVFFAFHTDDNGQDASGWAVDNIRIYSPGPPYTFDGYWIYLDDSILAVTDSNSIDLAPLPYGEEHTLMVKAHYIDGSSVPQSISFTSHYLIPPSCFYQNDSIEWLQLIICMPIDSNGSVPSNFLGFNLYRDMNFLEFIPYVPGGSPVIYNDEDLPPGIYNYLLTAVYDLTSYGFPGETGESGYLSTAAVVSNCNPPTELEANYDQGLGAMALGWSAPIGVFQDQFDTFAVYRSDNGSPYYLRAYTGQLFFLDDYAICENENDYHSYKISALYTNGADTCESEFSNEDGDLCLGIEHRFNNSFLSIYPNPASGVLYIEATEPVESLIIFDSKGITVEQWNSGTVDQWNSGPAEQTNGRTGEQARDHVLKIPLNGLSPGLYLVRVDTGEGVVAGKVVVK
ncbi:MAG: T9SS type A sorting domain-containing protein [Bacteroidales bacterium]|nr:T9SS type A sorting domain-containing protein [Bacteroidales bacterium]